VEQNKAGTNSIYKFCVAMTLFVIVYLGLAIGGYRSVRSPVPFRDTQTQTDREQTRF
jgi:hypothetical protein